MREIIDDIVMKDAIRWRVRQLKEKALSRELSSIHRPNRANYFTSDTPRCPVAMSSTDDRDRDDHKVEFRSEVSTIGHRKPHLLSSVTFALLAHDTPGDKINTSHDAWVTWKHGDKLSIVDGAPLCVDAFNAKTYNF